MSAYYRRISEDQFRITFRAGEEFDVPGDGSPAAAEQHQYGLVGACPGGCDYGAPGGGPLNRILLNDVAVSTGGHAYNGWAFLGLASFAARNMATIVHEIGHGWMAWPHSFAEVPWRPYPGEDLDLPNPYSNRYDIMSSNDYPGWDARLPSTLAINRYTAGWIRPDDVALHLEESRQLHAGTAAGPGPSIPGCALRTSPRLHDPGSPRRGAPRSSSIGAGHLRSVGWVRDWTGRSHAGGPGSRRPPRYEGVFVARYDQTAGTGTRARLGPALYNRDNPDFLTDVGWGADDHSLIPDGESRDIGGGVTVSVSQNRDGSYEVTVAGGRTAPFEPWCFPLWFESGEYDTGCYLDTAVWE